MLRSMYAGVSGMKGFQTKLDVIGNNIANVNTIGYKKSTINFQDLLSQNMSGSGTNSMQVGLGSKTSSIDVVHTPGSAMSTGVETDLSIMGDGFFVVQEPASERQFLTRAGSFTVTAEGNLVTAEGYNVVGYANTADEPGEGEEEPAPEFNLGMEATAIQIDPTEFDSFSINGTGGVVGKRPDGSERVLFALGIANPENPAGLSKSGGSMYTMTGAAGGNLEIGIAAGANTSVTSGMLEMSNVDLTEEFTEMIIAQRGFQANSRTITTSDEILQEVVNLKR